MRKYSKQELSHLRWKLINQDGLTPKEAEERVKTTIEWLEKNKNSREGEKNEIKGIGLHGEK